MSKRFSLHDRALPAPSLTWQAAFWIAIALSGIWLLAFGLGRIVLMVL